MKLPAKSITFGSWGCPGPLSPPPLIIKLERAKFQKRKIEIFHYDKLPELSHAFHSFACGSWGCGGGGGGGGDSLIFYLSRGAMAGRPMRIQLVDKVAKPNLYYSPED